MEKTVDYVRFTSEESLGAASVEAAEGLFVKGGGFHEATGGELVDDEFDEADLLGAEAAVCEESRECRLGCAAVHAYDAADEMCQCGNLLDLEHTGEQALTFVFPDAEKCIFKRLEVGGGERLVVA